MAKINFFVEDIDFLLKHKAELRKWLLQVAQLHHTSIKSLNYIFCTDEYLHKINLEYLNHDTYTDIITFDNSDTSNALEGDIFISIERIQENALKFNTPLIEELHRVMVHGLLHLLGFEDASTEQKNTMREKEREMLDILREKKYF